MPGKREKRGKTRGFQGKNFGGKGIFQSSPPKCGASGGQKSGVMAKIGSRFRREQNGTDIECSAGAGVSARTLYKGVTITEAPLFFDLSRQIYLKPSYSAVEMCKNNTKNSLSSRNM